MILPFETSPEEFADAAFKNGDPSVIQDTKIILKNGESVSIKAFLVCDLGNMTVLKSDGQIFQYYPEELQTKIPELPR